MANRAAREKTGHCLLLVCENFKYRIQLREDHQTQVRPEIEQLQCPAGSCDPRVTEDHGAHSVLINLRNARQVEDDVHGPGFRQSNYRSTQDHFRVADCK
jgi:hypothetical protein